MSGDATKICSAAIVRADPNHYQWQGIDFKDTTLTNNGRSTRWLFCYGEGASGQGAVALWSQNSLDWRFAPLGFGPVFHAGDSLDAVVFDARRAAVTYDSMVGEDHEHAFTEDGGQTWIAVSISPYGA
jgi:hypothetical protein